MELLDVADRIVGWARDDEEVEAVVSYERDTEIRVYEGETLLDSITVNDDTYTGGGFGFYNYSQEQVRYGAFTPTALKVCPTDPCANSTHR